MNSVIDYYYGIKNIEVYDLKNRYYFSYNNNSYFFIKVDLNYYNVDMVNKIYDITKKYGIYSDEIIKNRQNQTLTFFNNDYYVLIKDNSKKYMIDINDILYLENNPIDFKFNKTINWDILWENKIDYYENQFNKISNKYSIISSFMDYYIGLGENAISYLVNSGISIDKSVISHRRIDYNTTTFDYYNPFNFIIDSRVRDFSEYIKSIFFNENIDAYLVISYLDYMNFNRNDYILLISRLLFPTYFFDMVDRIINNLEDEIIIKKVITKSKDYILLIKSIFYHIIYEKGFNIPTIEWIMKS